MLTNISYFLILGKPLIMYLGIFVLIAFIFTAMIGGMVMRGRVKPPIITLKNHMLMAKIAIGLALIHAVFGILAYL